MAMHQPTSSTRPAGSTEVNDPLGGVTQYTWVTLPGGDIQLADRIDPLGQDVHYDYDSLGNVIKQDLKAATSPRL